MILDADQRALMRDLAAASLAHKSALVHAHPEARARADAQIDEAAKTLDELAAKAAQAGIPLLRIALDGMHTSSRKTARDAIARGKEMA